MPTEVEAEIAGNVWKVETQVGAAVEEEDVLLILESMKMEIPVVVEDPGTLVEILVEEGQSVVGGQPVAVIEESS